MRSRSLIIILGVVISAALYLFMLGCSQDETVPTQGDGGTTDTISHPQYLTVKTQVEEFADQTADLITEGLEKTARRAVAYDPVYTGMGLPDSTTYTDSWHVSFMMGLGAQIFGLDSVQFSRNGVPQESAIGANRIAFRRTYRVSMDDTTVSYNNCHRHSSLVFSGLDGTTATISGSHDQELASKFVSADSTVWRTFDIQSTFTNIAVEKSSSNWDNGCPCSGSISVTVDATYQKDSNPAVATSWEFDLTFTNGSMEADVTMGDYTATYTMELCTTN